MPRSSQPGRLRVLPGFLRAPVLGGTLALAAVVLVGGAGARVALEMRGAAEERSRTDEAARFLTSVLAEMGPDRVRRTRRQPRDVLDDGVRRIRTELAGQPLLQARLFDAMGQVYGDWEIPGRARTLLEAGLGLRLRTLGEDHPAVAESRLHLAVFDHAAGDPGADTLFASAVATLRRHVEPGHPSLRLALLSHGLARRDRGDHAGAEALLREVVDPAHVESPTPGAPGNAGSVSPGAPGDGGSAPAVDATVAEALLHLGEILTVRGSWAEADSLLRDALAVRREIHGEPHAAVAGVLDALGGLALARGDAERAARTFRRALAMRYELFDPEHPDVAGSLRGLALVERARGNPRSAEWLLRRSLAIVAPAFGAGAPEAAELLEPLAAVRRELGDAGEAEALYGEALAIWSARGEHLAHPAEARALLGLAELRLERGEAAAAEPLFREAVAIRARILPAGHWSTAQARGALGAGLTALARRPEAEVHLTEAYETLSRTRGVESPHTREVLGHLVELYDRWEGPEGGDRYDRFATALRVRQRRSAPR